MLTITQTATTKEQLLADLENDGITIDANIINDAKNGDGAAMNRIGTEYRKKQQYDKAMAWYRLAAVKNNSSAQNNIGFLYDNGQGVAQDYLLAMEWFLKAAIQNNKYAWGNLGIFFENGFGVPADKHKALECYMKCERKPDKVKALTDEGIQLTEQDKMKTMEQLIVETEDILWAAKRAKENTLKEENTSLKELKSRMEEESMNKNNFLEEEIRTYQLTVEQKQQEIDNQRESIEKYKFENETMAKEIHSLKVTHSTAITQLETRDTQVKVLEREIALLRATSERPLDIATKRMEEVEKSNQNLERLLEQEKRLKDNDIMLLKQEMQRLLNSEKKRKRKLEAENRAMQNELKRSKTSVEQGSSAGNNDTNSSAVTDDIELRGDKTDGNDDKENESGTNSDSDEEIKIETI